MNKYKKYKRIHYFNTYDKFILIHMTNTYFNTYVNCLS